jgi:hypothetical protein
MEPRYRTPVLPAMATPWDEKAIKLCERFPRAWSAFCDFTFADVDDGQTQVGAKSVWEDMRWQAKVAMRDHAEDWALNNNLTASFARIFMAAYPEFPVFRTRKRPSERKAA